MTTKIGGIVIDVDARLTKLEASLAKADREFSKFERNTSASGKRIEQGVGGINKSFGMLKGALAGAVIGFGIEGLYQLGRTAMQTGDDLVTAAERANISVERFQTLKEVFRVAEVDAAKFDKALARLNSTLGDVQRGVQDEATKALDQMGIQARILSGEITTTDGLIDAIAASSKDFASEAQFTSAAVDIFGQKLGVELAPALLKGADGFGTLEQAVIDSGVVMDDFTANQLADANEAVEKFTADTGKKFTIWAGGIVTDLQYLSDETATYMNMLKNLQIGAFLSTSAAEAALMGKLARGGSTPLTKAFGAGPGIFNDAMKAVRDASQPKIAPIKVGGGGGRKRSGGGGSSRRSGSSGLSEEQKLTQEFEKQVIANNRLLEITVLREEGSNAAAETLQRMWDISDKFPKLEAGKLEILKQQVMQLEEQTNLYDELDAIQKRFEQNPLVQTQDELTAGLDALNNKTGSVAEALKSHNVTVTKSFQDMANDTISAVEKMSSAIEGGGFFDILTGFISLGLQLGSIGAFGKNIQTKINTPVQGFAKGTNFAPGGMALIGENGPELMNVPRGAQIIPNHRLGGAGYSASPTQISVEPSPYFDVRVNGQIMQAAPAIAGAGAKQAMAVSSRANRRSVRR